MMGPHEEYRELCAALTAGELSEEERARLAAHLAVCSDCRQLKREYEATAGASAAAFAEAAADRVGSDGWSVEQAEERFFRNLEEEERKRSKGALLGGRHSYRPLRIDWREIWMPFAATILLAAALGITVYRAGIKRGTDTALKTLEPSRASENSLEAEVSDAGHERSALEAKLAESSRSIDNLKRQLAEQVNVINALKTAAPKASEGNLRKDPEPNREAELAAAETKLAGLQKAMDVVTGERDRNAREAARLEAKVNELTELVRTREEALDQKDAEVAKSQELLEHDRDIRELMGARELYMADVHDVSGRGTEKTYGRVFYTKGKSLIFYAFDLDVQPGFEKAKSFQAWGRKGPDKMQARNLGIFYEDNASKKRWVLKAEDPKTLEDIDAVFVTVEPHGGSPHPSGKQLLFASLNISPNHP